MGRSKPAVKSVGGDGNAGRRRWFPAECGFPPRNERRWRRRRGPLPIREAGKRRGAGISAGGRRMRRDWAPSSDGGSRFAVPVSARKPACNRYATHTNGRRVSGWMTICRGTEAALRRPAEPWDSHAVLQAGKQRPLRGACCRCGFLRGVIPTRQIQIYGSVFRVILQAKHSQIC